MINREPTTQEITQSITAISIAAGFMRALDTGYEYVFNHQELELIRHFFTTARANIPAFLARSFVKGMTALPYSAQTYLFTTRLIGLPLGYEQLILLRKFTIKNKIEQAMASGVQQVVFLGGGFDTRSLLASIQHPEVRFFEIDREFMHRTKVKCIETIPATLALPLNKLTYNPQSTCVKVNENLFYIGADLAVAELRDVLRVNGFDERQKTLFIAEGLTTYLSETENRNLLIKASQFMKDEDELLTSFLEKIQSTTFQNYWLKSSGEKYKFELEVEHVIPFVASGGFHARQRFIANDMLERLGETNLAGYHREHAMGRENYVLLTKAPVPYNARFYDIPVLSYPLPPKPAMSAEEAPQGLSCRLL